MPRLTRRPPADREAAALAGARFVALIAALALAWIPLVYAFDIPRLAAVLTPIGIGWILETFLDAIQSPRPPADSG